MSYVEEEVEVHWHSLIVAAVRTQKVYQWVVPGHKNLRCQRGSRWMWNATHKPPGIESPTLGCFSPLCADSR